MIAAIFFCTVTIDFVHKNTLYNQSDTPPKKHFHNELIFSYISLLTTC